MVGTEIPPFDIVLLTSALASSKSGLHGLSHWIAANHAKDGITCNVVAPALIADTIMLPGDPGQLASRIPVGRLGRPDEVAKAVVLMVTTGYLTNQTLLLDGWVGRKTASIVPGDQTDLT